METLTEEERQRRHEEHGQLALQAMRRGVRKAHLNGTAYDPDGTGRAYWETHDEFGQPIEPAKSAEAAA